ncbi:MULTISPECIES: flagellar basal-body MS-ring/collar protein FliF [Tatumella]|uniref:Flagellar M-ring protein n=1 Tax=Tatumella punctata TaxID=399969 RepID=A0ABW1VRW2_9GAMM|nr:MULTISPECIES: flagellar basal-body MS-ring/collar protein FliF [unclassified Tatumella]MBS0856706.1 flagellar M-ring protein FliF [Tatumella sp. JGM16]MBS0878045.1 flagellar M-ring protein FliF [Tatumella sp. JGM82]MBS0891232.1 flagellar M-ring protein FliF [Tatumella sp. JGM94]MBS0902611.1 flagellar M-ring protein FliF [Tatumella sp. JGM100]MBS0912920.1 flagellar M-ring protein FliF [Tatumella sp. JGM91]
MTINPADISTTFSARAQHLLEKLRTSAGIPLIFAAAVSVAIVVGLVLWAKAPDYKMLYNNISEQDGGNIISSLGQMNVPYRLDENTGNILVPASQVRELRLKLAEQGLPRGGSTGFELLDHEKFGISQFSEQINYQRALEGELARTIESLGAVRTARVHLAVPKASVFVRDNALPTASVTLQLQPGRALDDGQVNAIVHMVSSSVSRLPPANVTIIDQNGALLTSSVSGGQLLNSVQLKYTAEVERNMRQRIEDILGPVVGRGNVRAQVTAEINFDKQEQTDEHYTPNNKPDSQAIRSQQSSDSQQNGGILPGGVPGALTNQPSPAPVAPVTTPQTAPPATPAAQNGAATSTAAGTAARARATVPQNQQSQHDSTTNYELDRTVRHTQLNTGDIKRLSVAVVVNYQAGEQGKARALPEQQLQQITALTKEAMGFSASRGDSVRLVNTPFNRVTDDNSPPLWKTPQFADLLLSGGRWLIVIIAALLLYRKAVKPLLEQRRAAASQEKDIALSSSAPETEPDNSSDGTLQETARKAQQRINSEILSRRIREMSENDPQVVALVVRDWMGNEL